MRPISPRVRKALAADPRMKTCALAHLTKLYGYCEGRVQWHHVWMYANNQIDEVWSIVGGCERHHELVQKDSRVKSAFERASLGIATDKDLAKYPRANWKQRLLYLRETAPKLPVDKRYRAGGYML